MAEVCGFPPVWEGVDGLVVAGDRFSSVAEVGVSTPVAKVCVVVIPVWEGVDGLVVACVEGDGFQASYDCHPLHILAPREGTCILIITIILTYTSDL